MKDFKMCRSFLSSCQAFLQRFFLLFLFCFSLVPLAGAVEIQHVVSDSGVEAWLVEDNTIPVISLHFAFRQGAASDPEDRVGVANMLTTMLDEGAGDLDSAAFQEKIDNLAIRMFFRASLDRFAGEMKTLTRHADEAFRLLGMALNAPRFDESAIERMRAALIADIRIAQDTPDQRAYWGWFKHAFGSHPYARPVKGTVEGVSAVKAHDLRAAHARIFKKDLLKISVVGNIDPARLKKLLDLVFGGLPTGGERPDSKVVPMVKGPWVEKATLDIPQTAVIFGLPGISPKDPDFYPACVLNEILGGGSFTSRLYLKVREEKGLVYSIWSFLYSLTDSPLFLGGFSSSEKKVQEVLSIIRREFEQIAKEGPTDDELQVAKSYLKDSYPLRFDSNSRIANELVNIQMDGFGIDYIHRYGEFIDSVTKEQVSSLARRYLDHNSLMISEAGRSLPASPVSP